MLTIGIHKNKYLPGRCTNTALNSSAIANVVGMTEDPCTCIGGNFSGVVGRSIVDHHNFEIRIAPLNGLNQIGNGFGFIKCRNHN